MATSHCGTGRKKGARRARGFRTLGQTLAFAALPLLVAVLWVTACAPAPSTPEEAPSTPEEAIVGKWLNAQGGTIHFYTDGTGLIPAIHGEVEDLPPVAFKYLFNDDTHIRIDMGEQGGEQRVIVVEIKLEGDQMTWLNPASGAQYVYTRQK